MYLQLVNLVCISMSLYPPYCRIQWKIPSEAYTTSKASAYGSNSNEMESAIDSIPGIPVEESHMDEPIETLEESTVAPAASGPGITEPLINAADNECYLLWQGVLPKRIFHGFRFVVSAIYVD